MSADVGRTSVTRRIFESRANRDEKCFLASSISARERRILALLAPGVSPLPTPRDAASSRASRVRRARPRPRRRLRLRDVDASSVGSPRRRTNRRLRPDREKARPARARGRGPAGDGSPRPLPGAVRRPPWCYRPPASPGTASRRPRGSTAASRDSTSRWRITPASSARARRRRRSHDLKQSSGGRDPEPAPRRRPDAPPGVRHLPTPSASGSQLAAAHPSPRRPRARPVARRDPLGASRPPDGRSLLGLLLLVRLRSLLLVRLLWKTTENRRLPVGSARVLLRERPRGGRSRVSFGSRARWCRRRGKNAGPRRGRAPEVEEEEGVAASKAPRRWTARRHRAVPGDDPRAPAGATPAPFAATAAIIRTGGGTTSRVRCVCDRRGVRRVSATS